MKSIFGIAICCALLLSHSINAQVEGNNKTAVDEEGPIMFQFEPNYETVQILQRETLLKKIKALDSLPISERKRLRLIKELYRESRSIKFQKSVLVNTEFENEDFEN